uniref:EF-hand domain-containing protein n=1 Tax=Acrobeloides nanus TaxID=290746 RepID=A0A914BXK1_9BILA
MAKDHFSVEKLAEKHPDVDKFLIQKWVRAFDMFFDQDATHELEWHDFYKVIRQVRDIYGKESAQNEFAHKTMEALWKGLCRAADSDKNEQISIDEWINLLKPVDIKNRTEPKWFDDYNKFMFKLFDVAADGVIDVAEYTDGMSAYGYSTSKCHEAFKLFAMENGKPIDKITPQKWEKLFFEFFWSKDKKAPGNHLFGKVEV